MPLPPTPQSDPEKASLFVNIVIHDASEAIKAKVRESFNHHHGPASPASASQGTNANDDSSSVGTASTSLTLKQQRQLKIKTKVFDVAHKIMPPAMKQKIANKVSNRHATDFEYSERLTETVSASICQQTTAILRGKGISGLVQMVYKDGPYLILELQVQHVDTNVFDMYASPEGVSASAVIMRTLGQMTPLVEQDLLPHLVQSHLFRSLQSLLQESLQKHLLITDTIIVPEQYQARYFYSYAQELKQYQNVVLRELRQAGIKQTPVPPPLPVLHQAWQL